MCRCSTESWNGATNRPIRQKSDFINHFFIYYKISLCCINIRAMKWRNCLNRIDVFWIKRAVKGFLKVDTMFLQKLTKCLLHECLVLVLILAFFYSLALDLNGTHDFSWVLMGAHEYSNIFFKVFFSPKNSIKKMFFLFKIAKCASILYVML